MLVDLVLNVATRVRVPLRVELAPKAKMVRAHRITRDGYVRQYRSGPNMVGVSNAVDRTCNWVRRSDAAASVDARRAYAQLLNLAWQCATWSYTEQKCTSRGHDTGCIIVIGAPSEKVMRSSSL
jgi:hypothetical protein